MESTIQYVYQLRSLDWTVVPKVQALDIRLSTENNNIIIIVQPAQTNGLAVAPGVQAPNSRLSAE